MILFRSPDIAKPFDQSEKYWKISYKKDFRKDRPGMEIRYLDQ